jgi:hypothetical protein
VQSHDGAASTALVLFAFDRPDALSRTIDSLEAARAAWSSERSADPRHPLIVSLDGPRDTLESRRRVRDVRSLVERRLPDAEIRAEAVNRGLPTILMETLTPLFSAAGYERVICVEDDVELAPTTLLALETISDSMRHRRSPEQGHVISAAPPHRDGSLEHQALLIDAEAHRVSIPFVRDYIERFRLDGAAREGAYGDRDHAAIAEWSAAIARQAALSAPTGTSQDRMRELAWRRAGVSLLGAPMRLVRHRGLWGQHNTPWYALRTGQIFQRVDRSSWRQIRARLGGAG